MSDALWRKFFDAAFIAMGSKIETVPVAYQVAGLAMAEYRKRQDCNE